MRLISKSFLFALLAFSCCLSADATSAMGSVTVKVGGTAKLTPSDSNIRDMFKNLAKSYSWKSENTDCVKITSSNAYSCTIQGLKPTANPVKVVHVCTIINPVTTNVQTMESYYLVTVVADEVKITGMTINLEQTDMYVGESLQLNVQVYPENATNQILSWTSGNEAVAKVDEYGLVTAYAVGKTEIKCEATDGSGVSASCQINVNKDKQQGELFNRHDVNKDRAVDVSDIVAVINHIAGIRVFEKADVNGDQLVNISDVVSLINFIAQFGDIYPVS